MWKCQSCDLSLVDEVWEHREGLVDVGRRVGSVYLREVDVGGAEPSQAAFAVLMINRCDLPRRLGSRPIREGDFFARIILSRSISDRALLTICSDSPKE